MRLGLWNRLAVVVIGLALAIAPVGLMVMFFGDYSDSVSSSYNLCMSRADDRPIPEMGEAIRLCNAIMERSYDTNTIYTWQTWRELFLGTAIVCAVIYALIWGTAATIRWVMAGRKITPSP